MNDTASRRPNYAEIYDDIISRQDNYNRPEHSPGYQTCVQASEELRRFEGNALDVGCGVGFVVEYLASSPFRLTVWGVDASAVAVERARARIAVEGPLRAERIQQVKDAHLPFGDGFFSLVTCFDMLEHLDEADIDASLVEMWRVLRPGGTWFCTVSCRPAGSTDRFGDNLHRTVRGVDWWLARTQPDKAVYDSAPAQLTLWKRNVRAVQ